MKIALVDDESSYLDEIADICREFGKSHRLDIEIASFLDGESFLAALEKNNYSIVFMDIYMRGIGGISAALHMRKKDFGCVLIFLTSSKEHMPDAFSCHAFEYITKPFSKERIEYVLSDAFKVLPPSAKYIEIYSNKETIPILLDDLYFAATDAHYLEFGLRGGKMLRSRMTMSEFLKRVGEDSRFITINKGIVVNADYVFDFANHCCILENGVQFPVRIRDFSRIEQKVQDYHFEKIRQQQWHIRNEIPHMQN